jgi:hypothetical protein
MARRLVFIASLAASFVVLSELADRGAPRSVLTGTVVNLEAGAWIAVANYSTEPGGVRIVIRDTTVYEGHVAPGVRVTVWYRSVGERRPVADVIRVLP